MKAEQECREDEVPENGPRTIGKSAHPAKEELRRFMEGELTPEGAMSVVRHLLRQCPVCARETRRLWSFGEERPRALPNRPTRQPRQVGVWQ